ncbi:unnamed protein product [Meloidogyne enterolobii]|uniref:Uncharacterized protein n=1 Tax=Meloidogyne enterolobii TaxID=390850 RepID=A0ACB0XNX5_MELEN
MKNFSRFKGLPKIPKIFPSRLLKPDSKHNPCVVAKTNCLNGGLCTSVGHEWYCECPKTHYGRFCEFVADQTECERNLCQNNSTCYSTEHYRQVSNPNVSQVKACADRKMKDNTNNETCLFSLNVKYMCWCKYGNEGAFCEFTEGMRCCAEDHCNYHGLIDYTDVFVKKKGKFDLKTLKYKFKPVCEEVVCKCVCEEFYNAEDNCSTPDPCRDLECVNRGICKTKMNGTEKIGVCDCPLDYEFIAPKQGIEIWGNFNLMRNKKFNILYKNR